MSRVACPSMSQELINHSEDLKLLRDEGYEIEISNGHLLIHNVPYVNNEKQVKFGILVSSLELSGDVTVRPSDHVGLWIGDHPCNSEGSPLSDLVNNENVNKPITSELVATHSFSQKPVDLQGSKVQYDNYYHKMTQYINLMGDHASVLDSSVTAKSFKPVSLTEEESVFCYLDTATSRAGLITLNEKLSQDKIAIIGLGGTGSYILDFIAKTPVSEIHLFDNDKFLQHNAFRSPGAPALDDLSKHYTKVDWFTKIYSQMRRTIIPHPYSIEESNIAELNSVNFVFLCIDNGPSRKIITNYLLENKIPFIDVGMGIVDSDGLLSGTLRMTVCTPSFDSAKDRLDFADVDDVDYSTNIQIADMNALNASLAVIKWKKMHEFYHDNYKEHHVVYAIPSNFITNEYADKEDVDEA